MLSPLGRTLDLDLELKLTKQPDICLNNLTFVYCCTTASKLVSLTLSLCGDEKFKK